MTLFTRNSPTVHASNVTAQLGALSERRLDVHVSLSLFLSPA